MEDIGSFRCRMSRLHMTAVVVLLRGCAQQRVCQKKRGIYMPQQCNWSLPRSQGALHGCGKATVATRNQTNVGGAYSVYATAWVA